MHWLILHMFKHPCGPGINPTWSWYRILFMHCGILFANILLRIFLSVFIQDYCCSVPSVISNFCDPMAWRTPSFSVLHQLPEFAKLMSIESVIHATISSSVVSFSSCLQSFPALGSFPMNWIFASGGQSNGAPASPSVFQWIFRVDFF